MAGVTEDDVRQMVALLERYRGQIEMLSEQLAMLQTTEAELGAASELLSRYGSMKEGDELIVPVGGGVYVPASLATAGSVLVAIGSDVTIHMPPAEAASRVQSRRDRVREMIQQTRGTMEQIGQSAESLSAQLESAYAELEGKPIR
jgi:prefoldin alpha subunit